MANARVGALIASGFLAFTCETVTYMMASGASDVLFHLHIPKTAGVSFFLDASRVLSSIGGRLQVFSSEGCYSWADAMNLYPFKGRIVGSALMLRNPRAHVLSQYFFCIKPDRPARDLQQMPQSFEEWIQAWTNIREHGGLNRNFLAAQNWAPVNETELPFSCFSPVNLQTQHLACQRPFEYRYGFADDVKLSLAVHNMNVSYFVGLVEAYRESMCLFHAKIVGVLPAACACNSTREDHPFVDNLNHARHGVLPHNLRSYSEDTLRIVDDLTDLDATLYAAGRDRFIREIRDLELQTSVRILCDDSLKALQSSA